MGTQRGTAAKPTTVAARAARFMAVGEVVLTTRVATRTMGGAGATGDYHDPSRGDG